MRFLQARATALLFCPADRPDRYDKAAQRSDPVVLDLEDDVAPAGKAAARGPSQRRSPGSTPRTPPWSPTTSSMLRTPATTP
jgi:citrate lyase subunit beta/citryl-CoA lyase